ncbi:hypothetical protein KKE85_00605, partial [Patescibacteria group bacterium]|nr:hypothetical protein [Patescibacteria group bacterium]
VPSRRDSIYSIATHYILSIVLVWIIRTIRAGMFPIFCGASFMIKCKRPRGVVSKLKYSSKNSLLDRKTLVLQGFLGIKRMGSLKNLCL